MTGLRKGEAAVPEGSIGSADCIHPPDLHCPGLVLCLVFGSEAFWRSEAGPDRHLPVQGGQWEHYWGVLEAPVREKLSIMYGL